MGLQKDKFQTAAVWRSQRYTSDKEYWLNTNFYSTNTLKYPRCGIVKHFISEPLPDAEDVKQNVIQSVRLARAEFGKAYRNKSLECGSGIGRKKFEPDFVLVVVINMACAATEPEEKTHPFGALFKSDDFFSSDLQLLSQDMKIETRPYKLDLTEYEKKNGYSTLEKEEYPIIDRHFEEAKNGEFRKPVKAVK